MANRRHGGWSRTFRRDPQLQQFFLEDVAPTGKTLGVGSYGSVVEVSRRKVLISYNGLVEDHTNMNALLV